MTRDECIAEAERHLTRAVSILDALAQASDEGVLMPADHAKVAIAQAHAHADVGDGFAHLAEVVA